MPHYQDLAGNLHYLEDGQFAPLLLPAGAAEISQAEAQAVRESNRPPWSPEPLLNVVRAGREIALNRLAGIAFAAKEEGDTATVTACLAARTDLLNITKSSAIKAATDDASLTAAVFGAYAEIVATAPQNIIAAFAGIQS